MQNRLVSTTFSTSPNDAIATVDAYKNKDSATINALPDIEDTSVTDSLNIIKSGGWTKDLEVKNYLTGITANTQSFGVDKDSVLKGVVASNNDLLSSLKSLKPALQSGLTAAKGISEVAVTLNGITKIVKGADLTTLTGLGNMVKSLSGAPLPISFKDKSGLTNLCSNLVKECSKVGIPKSFSTLSNSINDPSISNGMVKNLSPFVIANSDTALLADISSTPYGKSLYTYNTNFIEDYAGEYNAPSKIFTQANIDKYNESGTIFTQENIDKYNEVKEYNSISDSFDKINPGWATCRNVSSEETSIASHEDRLAEFNKISASLRVVDPNYEHADELTLDDKLVEYYAISDGLKNIEASNPDVPNIYLDDKLLEHNTITQSIANIEFLDRLDGTFDEKLDEFNNTSIRFGELDPDNPDSPIMTTEERLAMYSDAAEGLKDISIDAPTDGDLTIDDRLTEFNNIDMTFKNIENLDENNLLLDDRLLEYDKISASLQTINDSVITELTLEERLAEYEKISISLKTINELDSNGLTVNERLTQYTKISDSLKLVKDLDIGEIGFDERALEYSKVSDSLLLIKNIDSFEAYQDLKLLQYKSIEESLNNVRDATMSDASTEKKTSIFSDASYSFENMKVIYTEPPEVVQDSSINVSVFSKISDDFKSLITKASNAVMGVFDTSDPSNINSAANTTNEKYMLLASSFGNPTALSELKRQFPRVIFK